MKALSGLPAIGDSTAVATASIAVTGDATSASMAE